MVTRPATNAIIPPGEFLREESKARGLTQRQLAADIGRPVRVISELCQGKKEITADTALDLERVLGTPAHVWLALESEYRLAVAAAFRLRGRCLRPQTHVAHLQEPLIR